VSDIISIIYQLDDNSLQDLTQRENKKRRAQLLFALFLDWRFPLAECLLRFMFSPFSQIFALAGSVGMKCRRDFAPQRKTARVRTAVSALAGI
jgi:hypothetical protein